MIEDIQQQLSANAPSFGGRIEGITNTGAIERSRYPVAVVYLAADVVNESSIMLQISRNWTVQIITNDATKIEALIKEVVIALSGKNELSFTGGKMESVDGAIATWSMFFESKVCF